MADLAQVLADLAAESAELDSIVAALDVAQWHRDTPAVGWTIAHQIGHLAWTDDLATLAVTDPDGFAAAHRSVLTEYEGYIDRAAAEWAAAPELLTTWRDGRAMLAAALRAVPAGTKVHWFGPPMSPTSMATARLMETWAHGQDVADALELVRTPTARLRHVAHLGVRTRDFAYRMHDLEPPATACYVELSAPDGGVWTWGDPAAADRVTGPALDFCLLVTQRRHRADLDLTATGADADAWLDIAQAFAGPPGPGRPAGSSG